MFNTLSPAKSKEAKQQTKCRSYSLAYVSELKSLANNAKIRSSLKFLLLFLNTGGSSATLGSEQSLADLIQKLQLKRKKKEAAVAASAAIETVPNGNLGSVFAETLKPSNLNQNLPVAKMLELAKDGIVSIMIM